jgi:phosphate transport system ATP-binding protein
VLEQSLRKAALWDEVKDRLNHNATTLSGGQQQRLCIARCLAVDPEVILMDEPAASLDPYSTLKLEESVRAMKGTVTVLFVTHDVPEAQRVSDFAGFLFDGRLVEMAETARIFSNAEKAMTRDYVAGRLVTAAAV